MAEIYVPYTVTVIAKVDLESGVVTRVVVEEDVTLDLPDDVPLFDDQGVEVVGDEREKAIGIAENKEWPAWDHGW